MQRQDKNIANAEITYSYLAMPIQKHSWNWSDKYFILRVKISKVSLFGMVLKRLKLPWFLMVWNQLFLHTCIWVSEEGQEFENFSKNYIFLISSGKN